MKRTRKSEIKSWERKNNNKNDDNNYKKLMDKDWLCIKVNINEN